MIEINLLPEEMRQTEGTPPARLATILVGVVAATVISFFVAKFWLVEIPNMKGEIKNRKVEIEALKKRKEEVEKTIAAIDALKQKVDTLDKLIQSRVRFARILDRLCDAVPPDGAWFRSFNVVADNTASSGLPGAGKRYKINLSGYTTGETDLDQAQRLFDLMTRLEKEFRERDVDAKTGVNMFLSAKFDRVTLVNRGATTIPAPQLNDKEKKLLKALKIPTNGMDFVLTMGFEMRSPTAQ
ncbi:MAG TPA: hypothetical protein VEK08_03665 [Planctomycetota bacterium]|nr:hypothetical protein [Planctomycetota bacterium]